MKAQIPSVATTTILLLGSWMSAPPSAYSQTQAPAQERSQTLTPTETEGFRIGFVYSKTGPLAAYGKSVSQGAKLALQHFRLENPSLSQSVQMVAADDGSLASGAEKAAERLVTKQGVHALVGSFVNIINLSLSAISSKYQIPLMMPRATDENLQNQDYAFSMSPNDLRQGKMLAQFASRDLKQNKALVIIENDKADAPSIAKGFTDAWIQELGTLLGQLTYNPNERSLGPWLQDIASKETPLIVFVGSPKHAATLISRAKQNGIKALWLGSDVWDSTSLSKLPKNNGAYYFFSYFHKYDRQSGAQSFSHSYYESYESTPDQLAAAGYEATKVLLQAYLLKKSVKHDVLRKTIETNRLPGIFGAGMFTMDHVYLRSYPFFLVADNTFRYINRILLQD